RTAIPMANRPSWSGSGTGVAPPEELLEPPELLEELLLDEELEEEEDDEPPHCFHHPQPQLACAGVAEPTRPATSAATSILFTFILLLPVFLQMTMQDS